MQPKTRTWWIDFVLVCSVLLLAESARGVVIGTLALYIDQLGGDAFFIGVAISAFSVGRLIASFAFGALADYWSTRSVLMLSTVGCIVGNYLFCFAGSLSNKFVLLVSRVLTGFGTGMLSVARTHVAVTTPGDERTLWMSWLGIVQFVGFAVTPAVGNLKVRTVDLGFLLVNSYTFATLVLLALELLLFVLLCFFMSSSSDAQAKSDSKQKEKEAVAAAATQPQDVHGNEVESDVAYHQLDDKRIDLHQHRQADLPQDEKEMQVEYLDDELHRAPAPSTASASPRPDWTPKSAALAVSAHDLSTYGHQTLDNRGTSEQSEALERLQQQDVIVYVEQKTPSGRDTIFAPHHFVFTADPNDASHPGHIIATTASAPSLPILAPLPESHEAQQGPPLSRVSRAWQFVRASYVPLVFVFLNFSGRGILSVAEAFGTKTYNMVASPDGTPPSISASTFFLIMGCMGLLVFLVMNRLVKVVEETNLLMLSFISMGIGFGVLVDYQDDDIDIVDFSAGMALVWVIGTPISQTLSVSMLSKHFSQQQKTGTAPTKGVGFWMGLVTASGSVGRIIFPAIAGAVSQNSSFLFASLAAFLTVPLIFFLLKAYKPYLPWIRERLTCILPDHEAQDALSPHRMRTGSSGDRTEMLLLTDRQGPSPDELLPNDRGAGDTQLQVGHAPMLYFVASQAPADAPQEGTALFNRQRGSMRVLYTPSSTPSINSGGADSAR